MKVLKECLVFRMFVLSGGKIFSRKGAKAQRRQREMATKLSPVVFKLIGAESDESISRGLKDLVNPFHRALCEKSFELFVVK